MKCFLLKNHETNFSYPEDKSNLNKQNIFSLT